MKAKQQLPEGYEKRFTVDLKNDKKAAAVVSVIGLIIMVALAVPMHFYIPIHTLFDMSNGMGAYAARFICLLVLMAAYMVVHELIHGITMKLYGTKKVKYGLTLMYAYAGSQDYYDKKSYLVIALAPVVLLGIVIGVVNALVPVQWFWVVYMLQLCNLSGAAGDLYVTVRFMGLPKNILINDTGVAMTVYGKNDGGDKNEA